MIESLHWIYIAYYWDDWQYWGEESCMQGFGEET